MGWSGGGVVCIICDQPVAQDQMEFAIGFAGDETMPEWTRTTSTSTGSRRGSSSETKAGLLP